MIGHRTDGLIAWALMAPALVVLGLFGIFPIGYAFFVSLHRWRVRKEELIGLKHYGQALGDPAFLAWCTGGVGLLWLARALRPSGHGAGRRAAAGIALVTGVAVLLRGVAGLAESGDPRLYSAFKVTAFYALGTIPAEVAGSLLLAYLLFRILTARGFFRILYFLPYITPMIATAVVFRSIFSPNPGSLANRCWSFFGAADQSWLYDSRTLPALLLGFLGVTDYPEWVDNAFPSLALACIVLYNIWVYIGYDTVIFLAGLSAIPRHYFEAAAIDGASSWQVFRHVTLPLISPTLFFIALVAVIGTFKAFNHIYIMRTPGALDTVDVVSVLIFDQIYVHHNAGYAAALALILFAAILGLTVAQNRTLGRRVFYGE